MGSLNFSPLFVKNYIALLESMANRQALNAGRGSTSCRLTVTAVPEAAPCVEAVPRRLDSSVGAAAGAARGRGMIQDEKGIASQFTPITLPRKPPPDLVLAQPLWQPADVAVTVSLL